MSQNNGTQRSRGRSLRDAKLEAKSVNLSNASIEEASSDKHSNKYLIGGIAAGVLLLVLN